MPLYQYRCDHCDLIFEELQKIDDKPIETCPICDNPVKRLIGLSNVIFKGSGWTPKHYKTGVNCA